MSSASKTVWCWRVAIRSNNYDDDDYCDEEQGCDLECADDIPIDDDNPSYIDDMNAFYDWLFGRNWWWIEDIDLIELKIKDVFIPRWRGFAKLYNNGLDDERLKYEVAKRCTIKYINDK